MPLSRLRSIPNALFLTDDTAAEWMDFIHGCVDHDFYHLPFYHRMAMMQPDRRAVLIRLEEGGRRIGFPLLLRSLRDLGDDVPFASSGYDATSVYGYPGPVASRRGLEPTFIEAFREVLRATLRELGVITAFSRLHPIIDNARLLEGVGHLRYAGETIAIDTTLSEFEQKAQYRKGISAVIRHLQGRGAVCSERIDGAALDAFADMYGKAMLRLSAPPHLHLGVDWFRRFLGTDEVLTRLFMCTLQDVPICGAIVTMCNGIVEVHLAATHEDYVALSPSKMLFDYIRQWGVTRGARLVHLGGGVGASHDSLYQFKSGFSKLRRPFSTWRLIVDESRYEALNRWRNALYPDETDAQKSDYFPEYRRPRVLTPHQVQIPLQEQGAHATQKPPRNGRLEKGTVPQVKSRIVVLGAGGHAKVVVDALMMRASVKSQYEVVGLLDDREEISHQTVLGFPVLGTLNDLPTIPHDGIIVAIGDNKVRKRLFEELTGRGERLITVVHPHAKVAPSVHVGPGSVILAGVVVNAGAKIGSNVILNTACTIDHDCLVESHAHICPGAHLGGTVSIGRGAFIGIGSTVIHSLSVGDWATVGGGAVVIRTVGEKEVVVGSPARPIVRSLGYSGVQWRSGRARSPIPEEVPPTEGYVSPLKVSPGRMERRQVAVFGAGGLGREMVLAVSDARNHDRTDVVCFVDDDSMLQGQRFDGIPVLSLEECRASYPDVPILCAMGDPSCREAVVHRVRASGGTFASFVHPTVRLDRSVTLGEGCIIAEGCVLTCDIQLGDFVIVNLQTTIGHDVSIGPLSLIGPGVRIGGAVQIGNSVHIGMGAMIVNGTREKPLCIGNGALVGAASCVLSSVPAGRAVYGSPARPSPGGLTR
jgi:sugar O-acyltransferase (sialic acid O-acetyltransferase NeuD family)